MILFSTWPRQLAEDFPQATSIKSALQGIAQPNRWYCIEQMLNVGDPVSDANAAQANGEFRTRRNHTHAAAQIEDLPCEVFLGQSTLSAGELSVAGLRDRTPAVAVGGPVVPRV